MNNKNSKWGNRDWIWTIGILVIIIILLVADFYNFPNIEANFSIISSAVSIALALVAIFIALKQDSDNQQVNNQLTYLLREISNEVSNVNAKVDQIDPKFLQSVTNNAEKIVDQYVEDKGEQSLTKEDVKIIVNEVGREITSTINNHLNQETNKSPNNYFSFAWKQASRDLIAKDIILRNRDKSIPDIQKIIKNETGELYSRFLVESQLKQIENSKD